MILTKKKAFTWQDWLSLGLGLAAVLLVALWVSGHTGTDLLAHSPYDSYTLQAITWRGGRIALEENYPWLELAIYQGEYYVSFPPVPAIPMWVLTFFVGANTPSGLITLLYMLGAYIAMFFLARRYLPGWQAALLCAFVILGGSLLDIGVSGGGFAGGVWYQAQMLGLLFTALAFCLLDGRSPTGWAVGLICIALAVGCRPFNALYVPVLLWMLYNNVECTSFRPPLLAMLPYLVIPALIAVGYGAYNYIRFANPFEFGHSFLPEYEQAGEGMMVPGRLWSNIASILRAPSIQNGALVFPITTGFAVYFTNSMLFAAPGRAIARAARRKADITDAILAGTLLVHAVLLMMHRSIGGWQYGTRYLCDLLPALLYMAVRGRQPLRPFEVFAMGLLIAFNVYGTIVFHFM